jgi:AraC family transcriptional regulator of adaptative response / DNA-3-methyladenine glycosylase II
MPLDSNGYYRALAARDRRFDGVFFVGVTSTGIYCRPVCTARTPRHDRCRFFNNAAAAERAGFRPCLRCRPELAPGHSSIDAVGRLAAEATSRIADGALNAGDVESLARELGVGSRHLRRVLEREVGVTPVELAQTQRLLLAKRLLTDSDLPVTEVAHASGFQSLRRFNALFRSRYRLNPSGLRRARGEGSGRPTARIRPDERETDAVIVLTLAYRPPFAWQPLLRFLAARATPGVETVDADRYARTIAIGAHRGWVTATHTPSANALTVEASASLAPVLMPVLARLRQLFDLDASSLDIDGHLSREGLAPLVRRTRGLRVPGAIDGFELAVRAILGQQVTVRGATTLAGRFAVAFGDELPDEAPLPRLSPNPERVVEATVEEIAAIGLPRARALSIHALARAVVGGELRLVPGGNVHETMRRLASLPGIGPWTAQYIAMRALRWPDAFPSSDLALRRAAGVSTPAKLGRAAERWSPWRAYAAMHLWSTPTPLTRTSISGDSP